jgi:hypothetical protein
VLIERLVLLAIRKFLFFSLSFGLEERLMLFPMFIASGT